MPKRKDRPQYFGFVPMYIPVSQAQCAFYKCAHQRLEGRRFCKFHSKQYDKEAEANPCKEPLAFSLSSLSEQD